MSEGLKLSERLRVAIALGDEVTLTRDMALAVMRAVEVVERAPSLTAVLANIEVLNRKRDELSFSMMRSIAIFCTGLTLLGWAL